MKGKKLPPSFYRRVFDRYFKEEFPKQTFSQENFDRALELCPNSELFGISVYYVTNAMDMETPGITNLIKVKVEETFRTAHMSKFDFLRNFRRLVLAMFPVMPVLNHDAEYIGIGHKTWSRRLYGETIIAAIDGSYLKGEKQTVAFNGVLSHELTEVQYIEQNDDLLERLPDVKFCRDVKETAVDERVYATNPRYSEEMLETDYEMFKTAVKGSDAVTVALSAPLIYVPLLKHGDIAGKRLRKRVLDSVRAKGPRTEVLAIQYEKLLRGTTMYNPTREDYLHVADTMGKHLEMLANSHNLP